MVFILLEIGELMGRWIDSHVKASFEVSMPDLYVCFYYSKYSVPYKQFE